MRRITAFITILFMTFGSIYALAENAEPDFSQTLPQEEFTGESETTPPYDSETLPDDETPEDDDILLGDEIPPEDDEALPDDEAPQEDIRQPDFSDDMENSLKMIKTSENIIFEKIPENQYGEFYDDYTIAQRLVKSEEYIIYEIPYWSDIHLTAYFYNGESINHFMIYASADNEEYTEIPTEPETLSPEGKWHKVTYKLSKTDAKQRYIKIVWQDLSDTAFTNWGQALGDIKAYKEDPAINEIEYLSPNLFAIPDSGETVYTLETAVADQMGEILENTTVIWQEVSGEKVSLTAEGILTVKATEEETAEYTFTATIPETQITLDVIINLMHYPQGDINSDFKITAEDLSLGGKIFMRQPQSDGEIRGDINKDGKIDIYDLAYISYNTIAEEIED